MAKLHTGDQMPDFTFDTAFEHAKTLYQELNGPTFLWFMRYYGCTLCQLDIHLLQQNYDRFLEKGAKVLVVMQSQPATIAKDTQPGQLPFDIICDPEMKLYQQFGIIPAESEAAIMSPELMARIQDAKALGLEHGAYEGNELQLPALFLLDKNGSVQSAIYPENLTDLPSIDEMLQMI